ncbi:MAG: YifB family Mg chelatase-like AAA ATPase [Kofleriaceae bacterium]
MLARMRSSTLRGIEATPIEVEVDVVGGLPSYHVVGLPAPSVREGAVRIRAALEAVGQALPQKKITINLAPADLPKPGTGFDLPVAIGVMVAECELDPAPLDGLVLLGELGLDGTLRPVRGTLAAAIMARDLGLRGLVVPAASAGEAAVVDGLEVYAAHHLQEVVAMVTGVAPLPRATASPRAAPAAPVDLADVRGQLVARSALEVAVAGGHNLMLVGPPGIGKSMLARRIPSILPPMSHDEALEVTKVYSAIGAAPPGLVSERPFRAPHHSVSAAALLGGGSVPRPGEITLAHHGVLFLDELPEFQRSTIESLRQPLEDREVVIGRAHATLRFPAGFLFVAAANPCPCGWAGSRLRECTCSAAAVERYRGRMSGPLLDRIDLQVHVPPVTLAELRGAAPGESSSAVRARVVEARDRQRARLARWQVATNAAMGPAATRATCQLGPAAEAALSRLVNARRTLSARAIDRIIKVARTIADLAGADAIERPHLVEAAAYRAFDPAPVAPAPHLAAAPP